ncbi:hypothetical protein MTP04_18410 [Lysinibacillus sp. PLM2]|nr:hypothetical protein MTP04_18410 [Lysinibacillus sp. PLM2]
MNEKEFEQLKKDFEKIDVPKDKIRKAREEGYSKFKKNKKRNRTILKQLAVVAALVLAFVTSIRVSPTFAQTIAKIPGFAPLVELITYDKGVKDIVENEYYEELGIMQTKNDLTLTILGTISDESGMIIFYQLEAPYDISKLNTKEFELIQKDGSLELGALTSSWPSIDPTNIIKDKLEVVAHKPIDYTNPNFEMKLTFADEKQTTFEVPFTLTKPIQKSKLIKLNKHVDIDGQKINIESIKISPLRAEIKIGADPTNTMQILNIQDFIMLDENGEEWGRTSNGLVAFGSFRDETHRIFIQSNYFREPETLTLVFDQIEVLPKGEDYIEVDFLKQKVLKNPLSKEVDVEVTGFNTLDVTYTDTSEIKNQLFGNVIDSKGNIYYSDGHSFTTDERKIEATYSFDLKDAVNPVKIYYSSSPKLLDGKAQIEIPLK